MTNLPCFSLAYANRITWDRYQMRLRLHTCLPLRSLRRVFQVYKVLNFLSFSNTAFLSCKEKLLPSWSKCIRNILPRTISVCDICLLVLANVQNFGEERSHLKKYILFRKSTRFCSHWLEGEPDNQGSHIENSDSSYFAISFLWLFRKSKFWCCAM